MPSSGQPPYQPGPEFGGFEHSPYTPEGQIEQIGAMGTGIRRLSPGKRTVVLAVILFIFAMPWVIVGMAWLLN